MPRQLYRYVDGKWVEAEKVEVQPRIHVIEDTISGTWHPCDGKMYDSKSQFRRTTKANGCIEYGNEDPRKATKSRPQLSRADRKEALIRAVNSLNRGNS